MAKVLVIYGTTEGQTAKVSQHVADVGRRLGHDVDVCHAADLGDDFALDAYDAAFVGASVHEGRHQRYLVRWVKDHAGWLKTHPSAFFSVCLAAASPFPEEVEDAEAIIDRFAARTGWFSRCRAAIQSVTMSGEKPPDRAECTSHG